MGSPCGHQRRAERQSMGRRRSPGSWWTSRADTHTTTKRKVCWRIHGCAAKPWPQPACKALQAVTRRSPGSIRLQANVSGGSGGINRVSFTRNYNGGWKDVATVTQSPYYDDLEGLCSPQVANGDVELVWRCGTTPAIIGYTRSTTPTTTSTCRTIVAAGLLVNGTPAISTRAPAGTITTV